MGLKLYAGVITYTHDHNHRLTEAEYTDGAVTYRYDKNGNLIQHRSMRDVDGDQMDDAWEQWHWGAVTNADSATESDGDGLSDLEEFVSGTDPADAQSYPGMVSIESGPFPVVSWSSETNRLYRLERSTNLTEGVFIPFVDQLGATPPVNIFTDPVRDESRPLVLSDRSGIRLFMMRYKLINPAVFLLCLSLLLPSAIFAVDLPAFTRSTADPVHPEEWKASLSAPAPLRNILPGSGETEVTDEIAQLARALEDDPVQLFKFVHNRIDYEVSFGLRKGATATLLSGRGNDLDQAALLIALLKAADPATDAHYKEGLILAENLILSDLLGVAPSQTLTFLGRAGIPAWDSSPYILLYHYWVEVTIDGVVRQLDPSFIRSQKEPGLNIAELMEHDRTSLIANALSGATETDHALQHINETALRTDLTAASVRLLETLQTDSPHATIEEIIGSHQPISLSLTNLPPALPSWLLPDGSETNLTSLPDAYLLKLRIQHRGIDHTLETHKCAGKRLTLFYTGAGQAPQLKLDGVTLATGNGTTPGAAYPFTVTLLQNGEIASRTLSLTSGSHYLLLQDFGSISAELIARQSRQLSAARAAGQAGDSEAVLGGALNLMALNHLQQSRLAARLLGRLTEVAYTPIYTIGLMAQETGYFIDIPLSSVAPCQAEGNSAAENAWFWGTGLIQSALEHGTLEQTQGRDKPGVSTVKLLKLSQSAGEKTFYAHSANWSSIRPQLLNYTSSDLAQLDAALAAGQTGILPRNAAITLLDWTGEGYILHDAHQISLLIEGDYKGGYTAVPGQIDPETAAQTTTPAYAGLHQDGNIPATYGADPVNLHTGDFILDHTDLTLGGPGPRGLHLKRHYSSRAQWESGPLGPGWTHSYQLKALEHSHGDPALGSRQPTDALAGLVYSVVAADLLTHEVNLRGWLLAALTAQWAMDHLTDNAVTLQQGSQSLSYIQLPDGRYNPPPGVTTELAPTNGGYVLRERFGTEILFDHRLPADLIQQDSGAQGLIILEAETPHASIPSASHQWEPTTNAALVALPNIGTRIATGYEQDSPRLDYTIRFVKTGTHYVWIRGRALDENDDSCHLGFNGSSLGLPGEHIRGFIPYTNWVWSAISDHAPARFEVTTPGLHTLNIWMREDGFEIDQILVTTDPAYLPEDAPLTPSPLAAPPREYHATTWKDIDHHQLDFTYQHDQLQTVTDSYGRTLTFFYNPAGYVQRVEDGTGRNIRYFYTGENLTRYRDPEKNDWTLHYDNQHRITALEDPLSQLTVQNTYDTLGCVVTQLNAAGFQWSFHIAGFQAVEKDPQGHRTTYTFDRDGRQTSVRDSLGHLTQTRYNGQGLITKQINARGHSVHSHYDAFHNRTNLINALGEETHFLYDSEHRLTSLLDPPRAYLFFLL